MARKSDIRRDAGLGRAVSLHSPPSSSRPWKTAFHSKPSEIEGPLNYLRENHRVSQISGLFLGFSLYSYRVRELLVCWLFFSLLFVLLALLILGGVLACYAGECIAVWVRTTAPVSPVLALGSAELHLKAIPDARRLK
jgi:hypothetical protein